MVKTILKGAVVIGGAAVTSIFATSVVTAGGKIMAKALKMIDGKKKVEEKD